MVLFETKENLNVGYHDIFVQCLMVSPLSYCGKVSCVCHHQSY